MTTIPFSTYTAAGNELSNGMDERTARESAQREANGRGEPIDVYQGSRHVMTVTPEIEVVHVGPSTTVPLDEYPGAVDAEVTVGDIEGEVTLVVDHEGRLNMWGDLSHWATQSLHGLDRAVLAEIVAEVRAAWAKAQS